MLVIPLDPKVKELLEILLLPHKVSAGTFRIRMYRAFIAGLGLDEHPEKTRDMEYGTLQMPVSLTLSCT